MSQSWNKEQLAACIDHTLLKAEATPDQIKILCREAEHYRFASVCINPVFVQAAARHLKGSPVKICTVIGFPLGANTSVGKAFETRYAVEQGAQEIDMVIHIGSLKAGDHDFVVEDIRSVVNAAGNAAVKVIIEACYLNESEKKSACELALTAGAQFVKTSTGFGFGGATLEDIRLIRRVVGDKLRIKASGGIHLYSQAIAMLEAGADRIGTSAGVAIISGA
jgi:deoxyribose-phosphate aldolase